MTKGEIDKIINKTIKLQKLLVKNIYDAKGIRSVSVYIVSFKTLTIDITYSDSTCSTIYLNSELSKFNESMKLLDELIGRFNSRKKK